MNKLRLRHVLAASLVAPTISFAAQNETKWGNPYSVRPFVLTNTASSTAQKPTWARLYREYANVERAYEMAVKNGTGALHDERWYSTDQLRNLLEEKNNALLDMREEWAAQGLLHIEHRSLMNWLKNVDKRANEMLTRLRQIEQLKIWDEDFFIHIGHEQMDLRQFRAAREAQAEEIRRLRNVVLKYQRDYNSDPAQNPNIQEMIVKYNLIVLFMAADDLYRYRNNADGEKPLLTVKEAYDLFIYDFDKNDDDAEDFTSVRVRLFQWAQARFEERHLQQRWRRWAGRFSPYIANDQQEKIFMAAIVANADISKADWLFEVKAHEYWKADLVVYYFKSRSQDYSIGSEELNRDIQRLFEQNACRMQLRNIRPVHTDH